MLLRKESSAVVAIPQPSHAWLSGQLARAWGNQDFAAPAPYEEVCLAAEQHDLGWHSWEMAPALDAETGLPQEFFKVSADVHVELWRQGVRHAAAFGRYPALLVSLHADTIYARYFDFAKASEEAAQAVHNFLEQQHHLQLRLTKSLQVLPETIVHNQLLIAALDWLSLAICGRVKDEVSIPNVPMGTDKATELRLRPCRSRGIMSLKGGPHQNLIVEPWPFAQQSIAVRAEGKRLRGRFAVTSPNCHTFQ